MGVGFAAKRFNISEYESPKKYGFRTTQSKLSKLKTYPIDGDISFWFYFNNS